MSFIEPKDSDAAILETIAYLCEIIEAPITKTTLRNALLEHPNFPSLASVCDVLTKFKIVNRAIKVSDLKNVSFNLPIVVFARSPQSSRKFFLVVTNLTADTVTYFDSANRKLKEISLTEFTGYFGGIVLEIETDDKTGEQDFPAKRREEKILYLKKTLVLLSLPVLFLAKLFLLGTSSKPLSVTYILFFAIAFINTITCALLLMYDIGGASSIAGKFCSINRKIDCASVIQSKGAKFLGTSLSILAASFCFGSYFALLIEDLFSKPCRGIVSTLTLISIPFILYSLSYQIFVIKRFCLFCLALITGLTLQVLLISFGNFYTFSSTNTFQLGDSIALAAIYIASFGSLSLLVPEVTSGRKSRAEALVHRRFKYNEEIFTLSLSKQRSVGNTADMCAITFGSDSPKYIITVVSDPYCGPCASTHGVLNKLISEKNSVQLKMVFYTSSDTAPNVEPVKLLLDSYSRFGREKGKNIIDSWYESNVKDAHSFSRQFGINLNSDYDVSVQEMRQWCDSVQITKTPTIFINGFELPPLYMAEDLQYVLN